VSSLLSEETGEGREVCDGLPLPSSVGLRMNAGLLFVSLLRVGGSELPPLLLPGRFHYLDTELLGLT
jgi:hypothetical protein